MNRRSFMRGILAAGVAPYVVTAAGVLMPVREIIRPDTLFIRLITEDGRVNRYIQATDGVWRLDPFAHNPLDLSVFKEWMNLHCTIENDLIGSFR